MTELKVCIGSSCHLHGAYGVADALKALIAENQLEKSMVLKASFCLESCRDGCCVSIGGSKITKVNRENVREIFEQKILPVVKSAGDEPLSV